MADGTTKEHKSSGLTPEQEIALKEIDEKLQLTGGTMTPAQKSVMLKYSTQTESPPTVTIPEGPKVVPVQRKWETMEDKS